MGQSKNIESQLLYTKRGRTQHFIHDTYLQFFLAKSFADRINKGKLSVKKAYKKYWSHFWYDLFWDVHGRVLLPEYRPIVRFLSEWLNDSQARDLGKLMTSIFYKAVKKVYPLANKPFFGDFLLFAHCCNALRIKDEKVKEQTVISLLDFYSCAPKRVRNALVAIGGEDVYNKITQIPYKYKVGRHGYINHLLYILCNTDSTKETLTRHLKELLGNVNLENTINLNGNKLYRKLCSLYGKELKKAYSKKQKNFTRLS